MGDRDELDDDVILEAIKLAAVAGGCRLHARLDPDALRGLVKAADKHSADATVLLNRWIARQPSPAAGLPTLAARRNWPEGGTAG